MSFRKKSSTKLNSRPMAYWHHTECSIDKGGTLHIIFNFVSLIVQNAPYIRLCSYRYTCTREPVRTRHAKAEGVPRISHNMYQIFANGVPRISHNMYQIFANGHSYSRTYMKYQACPGEGNPGLNKFGESQRFQPLNSRFQNRHITRWHS